MSGPHLAHLRATHRNCNLLKSGLFKAHGMKSAEHCRREGEERKANGGAWGLYSMTLGTVSSDSGCETRNMTLLPAPHNHHVLLMYTKELFPNPEMGLPASPTPTPRATDWLVLAPWEEGWGRCSLRNIPVRISSHQTWWRPSG